MQDSPHPALLPLLCDQAGSPAPAARRHTMQFLEQVLHVWPLHALEGGAATVETALRTGLADPDTETRTLARKVGMIVSGREIQQKTTDMALDFTLNSM